MCYKRQSCSAREQGQRSQGSSASPRWFTYHLLIRSLCLWQTSTSLFLYHHSSAKAGGNQMPPISAKLEAP